MQYDPRLPSAVNIFGKHYRTMVNSDPRLKEVFPSPPLIAYRRPPNIRDKLIRSKMPTPGTRRPKRKLNGMKKCLNCNNCPYVKEGKLVKAFASDAVVEINAPLTCADFGCVYVISCLKCRIQYIGKTDRQIKVRISEHRGTIVNDKLDKAVGEHFNSKAHKLSDLSFTILEKVFKTDPEYLKRKEEHYIRLFNTQYKGLNRKC